MYRIDASTFTGSVFTPSNVRAVTAVDVEYTRSCEITYLPALAVVANSGEVAAVGD